MRGNMFPGGGNPPAPCIYSTDSSPLPGYIYNTYTYIHTYRSRYPIPHTRQYTVCITFALSLLYYLLNL